MVDDNDVLNFCSRCSGAASTALNVSLQNENVESLMNSVAYEFKNAYIAANRIGLDVHMMPVSKNVSNDDMTMPTSEFLVRLAEKLCEAVCIVSILRSNCEGTYRTASPSFNIAILYARLLGIDVSGFDR